MNFYITIIISLLFSLYPLIKINYKSKDFIKDNRYYLISFLILLVGSFVRLIYIDKFPIGLNQDEASIGYEAYSIGKYGIDRNGLSFPVNLISWGSGQNALYAYLSIPFIKLFGLNIFSTRIVMSLIGCLTLLFVYLFSNKAFNSKKSLIFTFIFAIIPWHIIKSRWALESNLFPDIFLIGLIFMYFGLKNKKKRNFIISSIIYGISLYSYGTSYLFIPLFLSITYIYLIRKKDLCIKDAILYFIITGLVGLPMIMYVIVNFFKLDTITIFNITIPRLYNNRMQTDTLFNGYVFVNIIYNFSRTMLLLFIQSDGIIYNYVPYFGLFYYYSLPIIIVGIIKCFVFSKNKYINIVNILLISSFLVSLFIRPNINRINIFWIPIIFYLIEGLFVILCNKKKLFKFIILLYLVSFILFIIYYFNKYNDNIGNKGFYSLDSALKYSEDVGYNNLYITNKINAPYIYYLFYNKVDTKYFINNNITMFKEDKFNYVKSIGNVYFHYPFIINKGDVIISNINNKNNKSIKKQCKSKKFKYYIVYVC